jgi:hypothetical protein
MKKKTTAAKKQTPWKKLLEQMAKKIKERQQQ